MARRTTGDGVVVRLSRNMFCIRELLLGLFGSRLRRNGKLISKFHLLTILRTNVIII